MLKLRQLSFLPLLMSTAVWSDTSTWLELGGGVSHNGNGRFGEFTPPLRKERVFALGSLGLEWRDNDDLYRSADLTMWAIPELLSLEAAFQRAGDYRIHFDFRQSEATSRDSLTTVFPPSGSPTLVLPEGYSGPTDAQTFVGDASVRRQNINFSISRKLAAWQLIASFGQQLKEGNKVTGASERFGDAALFVAPVDQRQDSLELLATYAAGPWRINSRWYHSRFSNDARFISYANPINLGAAQRTIDMGPDNTLTRISLDGTLLFDAASQLSWLVARGDSRQDESFAAPIMLAGQLLHDSLDAQRLDTDARLAFRRQLTPKLGYRLQWEYRKRDNQGDVIQLSESGYSHLYDHTRRRFLIDGSYRLPSRMRLRGGVEYTDVQRTTVSQQRFRDDVQTTRLWSELRLPTLGRLNWSMQVEASDRDSSLSEQRRSAVDITAPSQSLPVYLLPGRDQQFRLQGGLALGGSLMLDGSYRYVEEDFDNEYFGLRGRTSEELSASASWQLQKNLSLSAYGLYQSFQLSQDGLEFHPTGAPSQANARWRQRISDDSTTTGISLCWKAGPTLDITVDYKHSENDSSYHSRWLEDADTGELAGDEDKLPGYGVNRQRLEAALDWQYTTRALWKLRYLYERLSSSDWAWQPGDLQQLAFGWQSPNYEAHALMLSVRYNLDAP